MTDIIERLRIESRREPHEPIWRDAIDEIEALRAEVERLTEALRGWWKAHRPVGWTEDQHRSCPHVNLATGAEKALADALRERLGKNMEQKA